MLLIQFKTMFGKVKNFAIKKLLESQLKNVPADQKEMKIQEMENPFRNKANTQRPSPGRERIRVATLIRTTRIPWWVISSFRTF